MQNPCRVWKSYSFARRLSSFGLLVAHLVFLVLDPVLQKVVSFIPGKRPKTSLVQWVFQLLLGLHLHLVVQVALLLIILKNLRTWSKMD